MKKLTKDQVIELLRKKQGSRSAKELADELEITPQYLSDIFLGRRDIGPAVLDKLGLERDVTYRPMAEAEGLR